LQPPQAPPVVCLSTLMVEAVVSSETSVHFHQTSLPHVSKIPVFILAVVRKSDISWFIHVFMNL